RLAGSLGEPSGCLPNRAGSRPTGFFSPGDGVAEAPALGLAPANRGPPRDASCRKRAASGDFASAGGPDVNSFCRDSARWFFAAGSPVSIQRSSTDPAGTTNPALLPATASV